MTDSPAGKVEPQAAAPQGEAPKQPDVPQIPKARLDEVLGQKREAEIRIAELEAKLKQSEPKATDSSEALRRVAELEHKYAAARIANDNGWTEKAADLVLKYQAKGLDAVEAVAAARAKEPAEFQRPGDQNFRAAMHGNLPPQSSGTPKADEWNFQQKIQEARAAGRPTSDVIIEDIRQRREVKGGFKPV